MSRENFTQDPIVAQWISRQEKCPRISGFVKPMLNTALAWTLPSSVCGLCAFAGDHTQHTCDRRREKIELIERGLIELLVLDEEVLREWARDMIVCRGMDKSYWFPYWWHILTAKLRERINDNNPAIEEELRRIAAIFKSNNQEEINNLIGLAELEHP